MKAIKYFILAFIFIAFSSTHAATIQNGDRFSGKGTIGDESGPKFKVTYSIKFIETIRDIAPFDPVFDVIGIIIVTNIQTGFFTETVVQATFDPLLDVMEGTATPSGKKSVPLDGAFDSENDKFLLSLKLKKSRLNIKGKRDSIPNIAGRWGFVNDPAGDMFITRKQLTTKFTGEYSGTGLHSTLKGVLKGSLVQADRTFGWTGTFVLTEDPNVKVTGTFNCIYEDATPAVMGCQYAGGSGASFILSKK